MYVYRYIHDIISLSIYIYIYVLMLPIVYFLLADDYCLPLLAMGSKNGGRRSPQVHPYLVSGTGVPYSR